MNNNVKKILKQKNISIYKLAEDIDMSYPSAHALVNRKDLKTTSLGTLLKIAEVLEVDIKELYE